MRTRPPNSYFCPDCLTWKPDDGTHKADSDLAIWFRKAWRIVTFRVRVRIRMEYYR